MSDKKLTDGEIVKALECCFMEQQCNYCPLYKEHSADCLDTVLKNALDLINRLQAENERLEHQLETLCLTLKLTKAEAYQECIEKVKEYFDTYEHLSCEECGCVPISKDELNNILKELLKNLEDKNNG